MNYIKNSKKLWGLVLYFPIAFFIASCSTSKKDLNSEFLEKWKSMAENSQGNSPTARPKLVSVPKEKDVEDESLLQRLPTKKMNLKLRKADVKSTLMSMARSVDLNMMVKDGVKGEITVDLNDIPWDRAFKAILRAQGLTYFWEGDILQIMSIEDVNLDMQVATAVQSRNAQEMIKKRVEPLVTVMVTIDYADPAKLTQNLAGVFTKDEKGIARGSVRVDEHSNSLIVQAIREDLDKVLSLIRQIDKPAPQVQIKANIVETTKATARSLGVQWGGALGGNPKLNAGGNVDADGNIVPYSSTGATGQGFMSNFPLTDVFDKAGASGSLGLLYGFSDSSMLDVQLQALQDENLLNILSSPSLTTLDNQTSFTETGEKIPYVSTASAGGAVTQMVQFVDAVLRLEITPHVIDGESLKMKILVKKDEVDPTRDVQGNPYIIKKQTQTTLIVNEGQTIVISGLTKQTNTAAKSGIPILQDIPVVKWLFSRDSKGDIMQEILIFITPKILPPHVRVEVQHEVAAKTAAHEKREDLIIEGVGAESAGIKERDKSKAHDVSLPPSVQGEPKDLTIRGAGTESASNEGQDKALVQGESSRSSAREELKSLIIEGEGGGYAAYKEQEESVKPIELKPVELKPVEQIPSERTLVEQVPSEPKPAERKELKELKEMLLPDEGAESAGNKGQGEALVLDESLRSSAQEEQKNLTIESEGGGVTVNKEQEEPTKPSVMKKLKAMLLQDKGTESADNKEQD